MKVFIFIILTLLVSCSQRFREPLCKTKLDKIPEQYLGSYRINIQQFVDNSFKVTGPKNIFLHITDKNVFSTPLPNANVNTNVANFCEHNDQLYLEGVEESFYSYSLIKRTSSGILITPLILNDSSGLAFKYVPTPQSWVDGEWDDPSVSFLSNKMIIDNKNISPDRIFPHLIQSSLVFFMKKVTIDKPLQEMRHLKSL